MGKMLIDFGESESLKILKQQVFQFELAFAIISLCMSESNEFHYEASLTPH